MARRERNYEEVENVNEEEIRKPRGRKSNKLRNAIIGGLVLVSVGVSGTLVYLHIDNQTPNYTVPATAIVRSVEDNTTFDETIQIVNSSAVTDLDYLSDVVGLSERLHELNLSKYVGGLTRYEIPEEFNVADVNAMIDEFEELSQNEKVKNGVLSGEDRDFTRLALTLESYERSVNGSLSNDAYRVLTNYGIPCVKEKVLDACGFDAQEVSDMKIGSAYNSAYVISFTDSGTDKTYTINAAKSNPFSSTGYVYDVIGDIYTWQAKSNSQTDTGTSYDGERNKDILNGINTLKTLTLMDCEITNSGNIKVTTTMSEVRDKTKALTSPTQENK